MNLSDPAREIISLIEGGTLTPEESWQIREKLTAPGAHKKPGRPPGAACLYNHPGVASRWSATTKRQRRKGGTVSEIPTTVCLECVSARDYRRCESCNRVRAVAAKNPQPVKTCERCPHTMTVHEDGFCYHRNSHGDFDCDCTGTKENR